MDDICTLTKHSIKLRSLEYTFTCALVEIQSLAQEVDRTLQRLKKTEPPAEKVSLCLPRPDSPVMFTPLSPAPRHKPIRRVHSSLPVSNRTRKTSSGSLLIGA